MKSGRSGDVYCKRCGRPLLLNNAWRKRLGRGREEHYCAEHVVIYDGGLAWRPLGEGEKPPELAMGDPEPATPTTARLVGSVAWDDSEPPLQAPPASSADAYEVVERPAAVPAFPGGVHVRRSAADDDFDPINDVGF